MATDTIDAFPGASYEIAEAIARRGNTAGRTSGTQKRQEPHRHWVL